MFSLTCIVAAEHGMTVSFWYTGLSSPAAASALFYNLDFAKLL